MSKPAPRRARAIASPRPDLRKAMRDRSHRAELRQEQPAYWAKPGAHIRTPFYGYGHVEVVTGHGDAVDGDYRAWLRDKDPKALDLLGPENSVPHDYAVPQAYRTAHSGGALFDRPISASAREAYLKARSASMQSRSF